MTNPKGAQTTVRTLHYAVPLLPLAYLIIARTAATCLLHRPNKNPKSSTQRYTAIVLLGLTTATSVAEAATYILESLLRHGTWASQDRVLYLLVSIFLYGFLTIGLLENSTPLWHPILGACLLATGLEIPLAAAQIVVEGAHDHFAFSRAALHVMRCLLLVGFCVTGFLFALQERRDLPKGKGDEAAPLLADETAGLNGTASAEHDGASSTFSMDSDESEPQNVKELKAQQQKRLEEAGSWLSYLKGFKVFVPMLLPSKQDRLVQTCLGLIGSVLFVERFLNVLVPRQLGIITDELTKGNGDGVFPWHAMGIWMLLSWLNSGAGVPVIRSLAELPVQQFAWKRISSTAFSHVMGLSMDFHNEKSSGELIRAIEQGQTLQGALEFACFEVLPMFIDFFIAFWYVSTLFDITMSYILVVVGITYVWIGAKTNFWAMKKRRRFNAAWRNESKVQNEAITNWQTVSHFNRAAYECERYDVTLDEFNQAEFGYFYAYYAGSGLQSLTMLLGRLAAMFLAVYRVSQGQVPLGHFITLNAYWRSIEGPLARVSWSIRRITSMLTDSERLLQLLTTQPSVSDAPGAVPVHIDGGHVEFDHVEFSYDPRRPTLKNVSFTARPGQTIALVGETGGGKSTILKLLYRYYDITSGSIRIDGQDIRAVTLNSLRNIFGMVPQDPALFNSSILDNVRYARLDATDDEVMQACKAAAIHDKILTFPDGYGATVGERGVKLSGGELQRIAIARAILRQPKIVLLDEATSMIDAETEALIQEAFKRLTASRTTFIIAHRLATIQHADCICVIHDGEVVESGTHEELFRRVGGRYVALWSKQVSKDVKDVAASVGAAGKDGDLIDVGEGEDGEGCEG